MTNLTNSPTSQTQKWLVVRRPDLSSFTWQVWRAGSRYEHYEVDCFPLHGTLCTCCLPDCEHVKAVAEFRAAPMPTVDIGAELDLRAAHEGRFIPASTVTPIARDYLVEHPDRWTWARPEGAWEYGWLKIGPTRE